MTSSDGISGDKKVKLTLPASVEACNVNIPTICLYFVTCMIANPFLGLPATWTKHTVSNKYICKLYNNALKLQ